MDGWMDGSMDGWMNGWMDGWMDGWMVNTLLLSVTNKEDPLGFNSISCVTPNTSVSTENVRARSRLSISLSSNHYIVLEYTHNNIIYKHIHTYIHRYIT